MTLGTIRVTLNDVLRRRRVVPPRAGLDPKEVDNTREPDQLRKLIARTFLRAGQPAEARTPLQSILAQRADPEASWLLGRAYLQEGDQARARAAMARAGSYRSDHPLEEEPSPYVGEARCQECHPAIFRDSLASRHTRTYYRGAQLRGLPRPDRPLTDPTDPKVTHAIEEVDGALWEETRVGDTVLRSLIEYAFGTSDRYLTMVTHNARDQYHIVRLSYYHTAAGEGWDRTILDVEDPTHTEDFQGRPISVCGGVVKCLYCHITFPRAGRERIGPETADPPSGASDATAPGRIISRRSRPASPTRRSSTPPPLRPGRSRRSSATIATSSTGTTGATTAKTPTGSARKESAGSGAGATPRAAGRSDASPATTRTRAPGRPRPHSTRPNASRATRPRRHSPPAGQGRWLGSQPSRDLASAPWTRRKGVFNATCPSCGRTHPTWT